MSSENRKRLASNKRDQRRTGVWSLPPSAELTPIDYNIEGIIRETSITGVEGGIESGHLSLVRRQ